MAYRVILTPPAERQLKRLRGVIGVALRGYIVALGREPRPAGAKKLTGTRGLWRLRVRVDARPWRIVYRVDDERRGVLVLRVVPRDEGTYRRL